LRPGMAGLGAQLTVLMLSEYRPLLGVGCCFYPLLPCDLQLYYAKA
jgi:hypothetical protein